MGINRMHDDLGYTSAAGECAMDIGCCCQNLLWEDTCWTMTLLMSIQLLIHGFQQQTAQIQSVSAVLSYDMWIYIGVHDDLVRRPLSGEERVLVWRFRWSLTNEKRALTKVLQCVDWGDVQESRQAGELLREWTAIDVADALELLSPAFPNPEVTMCHYLCWLQGFVGA